jgi:hypothetical protein
VHRRDVPVKQVVTYADDVWIVRTAARHEPPSSVPTRRPARRGSSRLSQVGPRALRLRLPPAARVGVVLSQPSRGGSTARGQAVGSAWRNAGARGERRRAAAAPTQAVAGAGGAGHSASCAREAIVRRNFAPRRLRGSGISVVPAAPLLNSDRGAPHLFNRSSASAAGKVNSRDH